MQRLLDHELRNHKMLNRWGKPALIPGNEEVASNRRGRLSKTSRELQSWRETLSQTVTLGCLSEVDAPSTLKPKSCLFVLAQNEQRAGGSLLRPM